MESMTTPNDSIDNDPMACYLADLARDACYRVDRVLKESAAETTELVYFVGENGSELGPFVRKRFDRALGLGAIYRELYEGQQQGRRFRYLPRVVDVHEAADQLVAVVEYVPGSTLRDVVADTPASGRLVLAAQVMPALCRAAGELHEGLGQPVVHRDLTPSNIVCPPRSPADLAIIDLGIARTYRPEAEGDTAYFGTRAYAPPEQYGFGQTTPCTDVYALGMTCFYVLTGREASNADRAQGFGVPGVPETVAAVLARACDLAPAARYGSATELGRALEVALEEALQEKKNGMPRSSPEVRVRPWQRLPLWVGDLWNLLVVGLVFLMVSACIAAVVGGVANPQGVPLAYIVYEYLGFVLPVTVLMGYALLDKRRLRRVYGWMRRQAVGRERVLCLGVATGLFVLWIVLSLGASALGFKLVA